MEKRSAINFVIILVIIVISALTMGLYDYNIVLHGNTPKFVIGTKAYEDGGTIEYTGFLYKIIDYGAIGGRDDVAFGTILMKYDPQIDESKIPKKTSMPNVTFNFTGTVTNVLNDNGSMKIQIKSNSNEVVLVKIISSSLIYKNGVKATQGNISVDSKVKCKINITNKSVVPKEAMAQVINIVNEL